MKILRFILWLTLATIAAALRLLGILLLIIGAPLLMLALGGRDRGFR